MAPSFPMIIAHRGGPNEWPPNTVCAIKKVIEAGADAIEIDVQVSRDGEVLLYHPDDLSDQTTTTGKVSDHDATELLVLNSASKYKGPSNYQQQCTLEELRIAKLSYVLQKFPGTTFYIDLKSLPADALVRALSRTVKAANLQRLIFYSTNTEHLDVLKKAMPAAVAFEAREKTFDRLLAFAGGHKCTIENKSPYVGFELIRELNICEKFKLGESCLKTPFEMWSPESMACTNNMTSAKVILFGIDTIEAYEKARQIGAYGVYTNTPKTLLEYRSKGR